MIVWLKKKILNYWEHSKSTPGETQYEQLSFAYLFLTDDKWQQVNVDLGAIISSYVLPTANMSANALLWRRETLCHQLQFLEQTQHSTLNLEDL